jgi:hypothetical protein
MPFIKIETVCNEKGKRKHCSVTMLAVSKAGHCHSDVLLQEVRGIFKQLNDEVSLND